MTDSTYLNAMWGGEYKVISNYTVFGGLDAGASMTIESSNLDIWRGSFMLVQLSSQTGRIWKTFSVSTDGPTQAGEMLLINSSGARIPAGDYQVLRLQPIQQ